MEAARRRFDRLLKSRAKVVVWPSVRSHPGQLELDATTTRVTGYKLWALS